MASKMGKTEWRLGAALERTRTTTLAFALILLAALLLFLLEFEDEKVGQLLGLVDFYRWL